MYWGEKAMLRNKNVVKLVSLAFAIILWVYVVAVENPPTKVKVSDVPITIVNAESLTQRNLALNAEDDYHMDIIISGTRSDVLSVSADDITATVDVYGYNEGEHYIPISVTVPNSVDIAELKTNSIAVRIEPLVSVNKDINIEFAGDIAENQEPTVFKTLPEEIEVKGAKSRVARVKEVKAVVGVENLTTAKQIFTADLSPLDANGNEVKNVHLSAQSIIIEAAMYEMKEVPLKVEIKGQVDSVYEVADLNVPETVKIKGLHADLKSIEEIEAKDVDISKVMATADIPLELELPEGIMLAKESENACVSIIIKGISVKQFDIPYGDLQNLMTTPDNGLFSAIMTETVKIKVSAKEEVINNLTLDQLNLRVDLKGLTKEGSYMVPVQFDQPADVVKVVVEPAEVNVMLSTTQ